MYIEKNQKTKQLSTQFQDDLLKCFSLAPGIDKDNNNIFLNSNYSFMNSYEIKKDLENIFGKSNYSVEGKQRKAKFFASEFNEKIIICTCEKDIGTKWYLADPEESGSRYGNPMLLSWDKEVKHFWPDFCLTLKQLIEQAEKKPSIKKANRL